MMSKSLLVALMVVPTFVPVGACDDYNPPPEPTLVQPTVGFWTSVAPIEIVFTEPIDPASLVITVWPSEKDIEGNFRPDVKPLVENCSLATSPCGVLTLSLDEPARKATIVQNDAFEAYEGKPLVLEVHAGLSDPQGRRRHVKTEFDFQINPLCGNQAIDIDLETGAMTLVANLQVLPIWLHMVLDFGIDKTNGKALVVGTFARLKPADPSYPTNFPYPGAHTPELGETGWAVAFQACIVKQTDGTYFLQSEPFDVNITVLNSIPVTLSGFTVQGTLVPGGAKTADCQDVPGACEGRDKGSGTLSTSGGAFGADPPTPVDPITTAWNGFGFTQAELDGFPGLPRVCAEKPCETMDTNGGDCQLSDPWEPEKVADPEHPAAVCE